MQIELIIWGVVFILSLTVLIKAADIFTNHSEKIGLIMGISPFVIGITIVSIGTSVPELASSIVSVIQGHSEIVAGNAVGSNIANILLVIGVAAIVAKKMLIDRVLINLDGPLLLGATAVFVMLAIDGTISFPDAIVLITGYGIYVGYTLLSHKGEGDQPAKKKVKTKTKRPKGLGKSVVFALLSIIGIAVGAKYTIDSVTRIAEILDIGASVIALTAVAIGTSLPELLISVRAALRKKYELALGNAFGSNIFNILAVVGIPALIKPLEVSEPIIYVAIPFMVMATVLFVISGISKKIHNWEGFFYVLLYLIFIGKIFHIL